MRTSLTGCTSGHVIEANAMAIDEDGPRPEFEKAYIAGIPLKKGEKILMIAIQNKDGEVEICQLIENRLDSEDLGHDLAVGGTLKLRRMEFLNRQPLEGRLLKEFNLVIRDFRVKSHPGIAERLRMAAPGNPS